MKGMISLSTTNEQLNEKLEAIYVDETSDKVKLNKMYSLIFSDVILKAEEKRLLLFQIINERGGDTNNITEEKLRVVDSLPFTSDEKSFCKSEVIQNSQLLEEEKRRRITEISDAVVKPKFYGSIILISIVIKFLAVVGGLDTFLCIFPAIYGMISFAGEYAYHIALSASFTAVLIIDVALFWLIDDFKTAMLDGFSFREDWKPIVMAFGMIAILGGISVSVSIFMRDFTGEIMLHGFDSVLKKEEHKPEKKPENIIAFDVYQKRIAKLEEEKKSALNKAGSVYQRKIAGNNSFAAQKIEEEKEAIEKRYGKMMDGLMRDFGGVAKLYATKDTAETNARIRVEANSIRLEEAKKNALAILTMRVAVGSTLLQFLFAFWIVGMANFVEKNNYDALKKILREKIKSLKNKK